MTQNRQNTDTGGLPEASAHLVAAWRWVCDARKDAPAQADVWHLRHHWEEQQQPLLATLLAGEYRLSPMLIVGRADEQKAMWSAQDALVLKWVALQVAPQLPLHARCEHIKGHEGGPASVRKMSEALTQSGYRWVLRTDVKGYYANIDKAQLLLQVERHVAHPVLRGLITQYVHYTVEDGGTFHTPEKGIGRSCPLSPLMGALYLQEMDEHFGQVMQTGRIYYARYMDDIVVLTHSRWQLRKHVRTLNRLLTQKGLCQHPDKTFIGRTVKGFDWMGAWLEPQGVTDIAPRAKANHREKVRRLYERAWRRREPKAVTQRRVSNYRWRWAIWVGGILANIVAATAAPLVTVVATTGVDTYHPISLPPAAGTALLTTTGSYSAPSACMRVFLQWVNNAGQNIGPTAKIGSSAGIYWSNGASGTTKVGPAMIFSSSSMSVLDPTTDTNNQWTNGVYGATGKAATSITSIVNGSGSAVTTYDKLSPYTQKITDSTGATTIGASGNWCQVPAGLTSRVSVNATIRPTIFIPASLPAGDYTAPMGGHFNFVVGQADNKLTNPQNIILSDPLPETIRVVRAALGCTLSTSTSSVNLAPNGTNSVTLSSSCSRTAGTLGTSTVGAYMVADDPTSAAAASGTPQQLAVSGTAGYIAGSWGTTAPACPPTGTSAVYWDGSLGPKVGSLSESAPTMNGTQVVTVKACNFGSAAPGAYSAQGVFSIVTQ